MVDIEAIKGMDLDELKVLADSRDIKYHPRTGKKKLLAKVLNEIIAPEEEPEEEPEIVVKKTTTTKAKTKVSGKPTRIPLTPEEIKTQVRKQRYKVARQLARIRVSCMNPSKKEWPGEIISVGSARMGTYKKYVPFNIPWHVPRIILNAMTDRMCSIYKTVTGPRGEKYRKAYQVPEFNIEFLDPLTDKELKDLADRQSKLQSIDEA